MNTTPVAIGDELTRRIDGLIMSQSSKDALLWLCKRADRMGEAEIVSSQDEKLLVSELNVLSSEQLAALSMHLEHQIQIQKGKLCISPHFVPTTQKHEEAA